MLTEAQRDQLKPMVRTMQIIVGALCLGVLSFLMVVLVIGATKPQDQGGEPFLTYVAVGMAVGAVIVSMWLPSMILRSSQVTTTNPLAGDSHPRGANVTAAENIGPFAQLYQTQLIVRCAILEGAAFFCLVSYMIEQHALGLVAVVVLLLIMLTNFPTPSRVETWIDTRLVEKDQLRQLR
jgi:hypothetical protein